MQAGALGGPADDHEIQAVFQQQGDVAAAGDAFGAKQVGGLVGAGVERGIGEGVVRAGHAVGDFIRGADGVQAGVGHGASLDDFWLVLRKWGAGSMPRLLGAVRYLSVCSAVAIA